ncbi:MAG: hypothetical protein ACJ72A_17950, partial [Nocardioidaceae bacterium]
MSTQTTLVVAPAGAGKSFLLASWFWESSTPAAWLSVDDTDRDGCQFWVVMAAAIAEVLPDLADALGPIRRAASPAEAVRALVGRLQEEERSPLVLVVDDVHLLDGGEVAASLKLFLKSMPPWFHLVLVSRSDPDLPLDRLRARGQLAEIRFAELKFSNDEAEAMLTRLTPSLTGEQIAASVGKADGWAAGLQFSALAARSELVQGSPAPYADEADLLVADYIWHEVLDTEADDLVQVLQDTSVVKRTNASLAATLAGRPDAFDLLLAAERRGLFVNRVGRSGWVEMHVVLRDVLVNEAVGRYPERVALLHSRAARWFEEAGEVISALDHWLLSGQSREGLRLLASAVADAYDGGRGVILARMLAQIPVTVVASDIQAMLDYAWCQFLVDSKRFLETVQQAATTIERIEGPDVTTVSRLTMLQSMAAAMTGDWALGGRRAAEAAASLGDDAVRDHVGRFAWNMLARDIALSEAWDDTSEEVQQIRLALSADPERRLAFEGTRAMGESMAGRPVDALRVSAGVRAAARVNNLMVLQGELGVAEGIAHRELGDRVRAVAELVPLTESTLAPMSHARVAALLELTQLRLDEGDLDAAELTFASATELVRSDFSGAGGVAWLARTGTLVALATGDLAGAHSWSDQVDDPFWGAVSRARVCIEEGRRPEAAAL